ncbi:MAG: phosphoribosylanthranilate isomerase [Phycisphaerales bacterium]|nr:phosphoribosylanthranilate isomerase [Phycisphaerales bacterium]
MPRTRVKICGVMRPQDAVAAARTGADAIGINFYPQAKRCISTAIAREILHSLPAFVTPVALFVDQDVEEIKHLAASLGIRHIQLHGHESPATVAALRDFTVLKAVRASRETLAAELAIWREAMESLDLANLHGFVLETPGSAPGGTGVENDWDAIAVQQRAGTFEGLPPLIAAGGLTPDNVAAVVRLLQPYAVDVSSGVEESFGQKSPERIAAFITAVGNA